MDKILQLISENSDLSCAEMAAMLNDTEENIKAKIKQYEKDGVIRGHKAIINFNNVPGAKATAYIELKVTPQKDTGFDTIAKQILDFDEVDSLYLMAGGYDLLACVKGDSITDIAMFVAKRLSTIDGVLSTNTRFQLKTYKKSGISFYDDDEQDKRSIIL